MVDIMANNYKTKSDLIKDRKQYSTIYSGFKGVDFASDHTQVDPSRMAYAKNLWKDYQNENGGCVETIPGFRRRWGVSWNADSINGLHRYQYTDANGDKHDSLVVHVGDDLYLWDGVADSDIIVKETDIINSTDWMYSYDAITLQQHYTKYLPSGYYCHDLTATYADTGNVILSAIGTSGLNQYITLTITGMLQTYPYALDGMAVNITYTKSIPLYLPIASAIQDHKSVSFNMYGCLFLLDGSDYYYVNDLGTLNSVDPYIPLTRYGIIPSGADANTGTEYEQRNIFTNYVRNTYKGDSTTTSFPIVVDVAIPDVNHGGDTGGQWDVEVSVNGTALTQVASTATLASGQWHMVYSTGTGIYSIVMYSAPSALAYIEAKICLNSALGRADEIAALMATPCVCAFDNRMFFVGSGAYSNRVYYCLRHTNIDENGNILYGGGEVDPSYIGELAYVDVGLYGNAIKALIPVGDTLCVLKDESVSESSLFFLNRTETGIDYIPVTYTCKQGIVSTGCVGDAVNFLNDPVFVSKLGVSAIGRLSIYDERALEHRSSMVDPKLAQEDLSQGKFCEYEGYLLLYFPNGHIYMADGRNRYKDSQGNTQYEWFYLEDIGIYDGSWIEYTYASRVPSDMADLTVTYGGETMHLEAADHVYDDGEDGYISLVGMTANPPLDDGSNPDNVSVVSDFYEDGDNRYQVRASYVIYDELDRVGNHVAYHAYYVETRGQSIGGTHHGISCMLEFNGNLYFGTDNGVICSFNFDKRGVDGVIPTEYYDFDGRTILCGMATKMDSCGVPHLTKNTVKKSTVIKMHSFATSACKIKVRTNKVPYKQISRIASGYFGFDDVDFADFSFVMTDQSLFAVREKEKRWVEKQYYLYSDEYRKPFSCYYIAYRWSIIGRYKG